jgi:hypothetical protein
MPYEFSDAAFGRFLDGVKAILEEARVDVHDVHARLAEESDGEWREFVAAHRELELSSTDDEVEEALREAIAECDQKTPTSSKQAGSVFSCSVANQLRPRASKADVSRVAAGLLRLEARGRVKCDRPRHGANRWRLDAREECGDA